MEIGVNTYGLGPSLSKDWKGTLRRLKDAGVTSIEPMVYFGDDNAIPQEFLQVFGQGGMLDGLFTVDRAAGVIRELRGLGFDVNCMHFREIAFGENLSYKELFTKELLTRVIRFMKEQDIHFAVQSFMTSSVAKMREMKGLLCWATDEFRLNGLELLVHNHAQEWTPDEGTCVMQWLLDKVPQINFELDLGWAVYAGVDIVSIIRKYPERFPLFHIKEIEAGKDPAREAFCVAPGEGILPLREIIKSIKALPLNSKALIIDQDNSVSGDVVADIARGIQNIAALLEV